jgi:4,5-DOPA dioxygenase extradiol
VTSGQSTDGVVPALFVGHGNPMNALADNAWTRQWAALGPAMPRPRAILAVSAHWYLARTRVTVNQMPRTIHDFGGFPRELYEVSYPAPGCPELAHQVAELLNPVPVELDERWGLDHGTWSVLIHVYPEADVPVVQLALDVNLTPRQHFELARRLAPLRDDGVLILGSGNVVHNLHAYAWGAEGVAAYDWAVRFESRLRENVVADVLDEVVEYPAGGHDAMLAVPTPEHYLPLLYVLGVRRRSDRIAFPVEGIDGGSVSMLAVRVG